MKCSKCKRLLPAYLDGELADAKAREVENHLAACASCRTEADSIRQTLSLLNEWPSIQPRLGIDAFRERLEQRTDQVTQSILPVPRWAAAVLAVMSIGVGAVLGIRASELPVSKTFSEQQIASAVGLPEHDDLIEACLTYGIKSFPSETKDIVR